MARSSASTLLSFRRTLALIGLAFAVAGCSPQQSALHPAGEDAEALARLFWIMTIGAAVVWLIVMGATIVAILGRIQIKDERFADRLVLIGGAAFPTVTLALLLIVGLSLLPDWSNDEPADLRVRVSAEQFWWRFTHEGPDGPLETANELHLPVGQVAEFEIVSPDVIHSFWIPALGGKLDAIPGRTNYLRLRPTKPGIYRGVCAEFCGPSHALMAFQVVVHDADGYAEWLAQEAQPARAGGGAEFIAAGCGACHTVRGVVDAGAAGPDLTHFAARRSFAADTLPITADNLERWIEAPAHAKPGAQMPPFPLLPEADRAAIVAFLLELT